MTSIVLLIYNYLMSNDNEHFCMSLVAILKVFSGDSFSKKFFCLYFNWVIALLLSCKNSLGIQDLNPLWHTICSFLLLCELSIS